MKTSAELICRFNASAVSLLWMDDVPLVGGKDYLIKLGTKSIPGILTKINYTVDVNTGEKIPADSLSKNGIDHCELLLSEGITAEKFSEHKTLGEIILIDRVTNMTSACGVVEEVSEQVNLSEKASFKFNGLTACGDIFEEFCYDTESLNVLKYQPVTGTYTVGDEIPTHGESYEYPNDFDIIILRDKVAVTVRSQKIKSIVPAAEYIYSGVPVVNGRGFEVLVHSDSDVKAFLNEYEQSKDSDQAEFFAKWVKFNTYRKVIISGEK